MKIVYKVVMKYADGSTEEDDEVFDTRGEADEYGLYLVSCTSLGAEIMHMSNPGDYPLSDEEADFEVVECSE